MSDSLRLNVALTTMSVFLLGMSMLFWFTPNVPEWNGAKIIAIFFVLYGYAAYVDMWCEHPLQTLTNWRRMDKEPLVMTNAVHVMFYLVMIASG